jgi:membrane peptidoglycan carboxypeptidase
MTPRRVVALVLSFILLCVGGGVVASGFLMPIAYGITEGATNINSTIQNASISLDLSSLPQVSTMYASDGKTVIAQFYDQNRIVVPLDKISTYMQKAVVAREDHRFFEHAGIDPQGIIRAFVATYIQHGDTQGGSTLTQQYVKNKLIADANENDDPVAAFHASEDTIARKLKEMVMATELDQKYSKEDILQGYLNIAQFGINIYGVETAAEHYFSTTAQDLTLVQAATIAAITKNPSNFDPTVPENQKEAEIQRNTVLNQMAEYGLASQKDVDAAKAQPLKDTLKVKPVAVGCETAGTSGYFCDYVLHQILNSTEFGKTKTDRQNLINQGGLKIYTTLDVNAQAAAVAAVTTNIPVKDPSRLTDVIAAIRPGTGEVLAIAQNKIYDAAADAAKDPTHQAMNFAVDAIDGGGNGFGPGSTFKPMNLAAWMQAGYSINTPLRTSTFYKGNSFPCAPYGAADWPLQNSGGGTVSPETPLHALNFSHNTTQAAMAQIIGLCAIAKEATAMGYHEAALSPSGTHSTTLDDVQNAKSGFNASMIIGSDGVAPLTMANVYATIAAKGVECTPIAITRIQDSTGKDLQIPSAGCHQAIPANIAETVAYAMNLNVTTPGGAAATAQLDGGRKTFAKTGTNENATLAAGGFVPQVSAFVSVGWPESPNTKLNNLAINGVYKYSWFGADICMPTWKQFMDTYLSKAKIPADNTYGTPDPALIGTPNKNYAQNNPASSTNSTDPKNAPNVAEIQARIDAGGPVNTGNAWASSGTGNPVTPTAPPEEPPADGDTDDGTDGTNGTGDGSGSSTNSTDGTDSGTNGTDGATGGGTKPSDPATPANPPTNQAKKQTAKQKR